VCSPERSARGLQTVRAFVNADVAPAWFNLSRSAEFYSAVSRIFNPHGADSSKVIGMAARCRMQFGDTADFKSALRRICFPLALRQRGILTDGSQTKIMTIYLICLVVGVVFTLFSVVAGHFFGGHSDHVGGSGGHAEAGADGSDMPGISIFSPTIIASFITAFGGFGLIFSEIPATKKVFISAPLSIVCALGIAGVLFVFLRSVFQHTQSSSESHVAQLAGTEASVASPIPANGVGEIAYVVSGTRYTAPARTEDGAAIGNGKLVKITRVVGTQFYVTAI
jgi:membrane protein implicated in regulation of membrane protease activity